MNIDDLLLRKSTEGFKMEPALLCLRVQLCYLMQCRIWRYKNK